MPPPNPPTNRSFRRTLAMGIAYVVLLLCVTVAAMEVLIRIFDPIGISYFSEAARYFRNMTPNDAYGYIHTPHYRDKLQGVDVTINSHGFRGPEFEIEKPRETVRLLILGDSVVFGWGAPQDSIFPARLQRMLERDFGRIEVISAGVGSWNTRTEYQYLKSEGVHLSPDVILMVITNNDIEPIKNSRTDVDRDVLFDDSKKSGVRRVLEKGWRLLASRSYALGYIQYFSRVTSTKKRYSEIGEDSPRWDDARLALEGIVGLCRDANTTLVIYLYASNETLTSSNVFALYRRFIESQNLPVFTLPDKLFDDKGYRNSTVDGHANTSGHKLIAEHMYGVLVPVLEEKLSATTEVE
ncbi:MAG: hypothetical protein JSW58_04985 [Candidatus Latescibacterota bacterium]|nr:MAG: hypothetical protein JSW58_04985 [Candidatus Latescibacterota bacterium]